MPEDIGSGYKQTKLLQARKRCILADEERVSNGLFRGLKSRFLIIGVSRFCPPAVWVHHQYLHARDRGCSYPGCDRPPNECEVHHIKPWANGGRTEPEGLTLTCNIHHKLIEEGWTTRLNSGGQVEWIPPPHLDRSGPTVNNYHHPERYLNGEHTNDANGDDEDDDP